MRYQDTDLQLPNWQTDRERRDAKLSGLTTQRVQAAGLPKERTSMGRIETSRRSVAAATILVVTALLLGLVQSPARAATPLERQMLRLTNLSRSTHDVHRLRLDSARTKKAHRHSAAMATAGEIYHTSDPTDFYLRGVRWTKWGENVGRTDGDLLGLQDVFMHSTDHRRNILDSRFSRVGIGVVQRDGTTWVTLFFYG
jgi:uncharacterized protein YkwD